MRLYHPRSLQILVDWDDDGRYGNPQADLRPFVSEFRFRHGATITTGRDFRLARAGGTLRFYKPYEGIGEPEILAQHQMKIVVDGVTIFTGVMDPIKDERVRFHSLIKDAMRETIVLSQSTSVPIASLWHGYFSQSPIASGSGHFDTYMTAPFILDNIRPVQFLNEFGKLFGGLASELSDGSVSFQSFALANAKPDDLTINADLYPVFDWSIGGKPESSVSRVSGEIVRVASELGQIATQAVMQLAPGRPQVFRTKAPAGARVLNWSLAIQDPDETDVRLTILEQNAFELTWQAANAANYIKPSETVVISGIRQTGESARIVAAINLQGEYQYGRQDMKVKPWAADAVPINAILAQRSEPLKVARMEIPVLAENKDLLTLDNLSVVFLNIKPLDGEDFAGRMLLGFRQVTYRRRVFTLQWDLIAAGVGQLAVWRFGDAAIRLGDNSYLSGPVDATGNLVYLGGVPLLLGGEQVSLTYSAPANYVTLGGVPLLLGGEQVTLTRS